MLLVRVVSAACSGQWLEDSVRIPINGVVKIYNKYSGKSQGKY